MTKFPAKAVDLGNLEKKTIRRQELRRLESEKFQSRTWPQQGTTPQLLHCHAEAKENTARLEYSNNFTPSPH